MKRFHTVLTMVAGSGPAIALAQAAPTAAPAMVEDIRDIREPIFDPAPWWEIALPYMLGGLGALALYFAARYVWRLLHRPRNPMQRALARIDDARRLAQEGQVAAFADELSEALRAYIEERFEVRAPRKTTEELLTELVVDEASVLRAHRDELGAFLRICDEAKFGGYEIAAQAMDALAAAAREFVTETYRVSDEKAPGEPRARVPGATGAVRSEEAA